MFGNTELGESTILAKQNVLPNMRITNCICVLDAVSFCLMCCATAVAVVSVVAMNCDSVMSPIALRGGRRSKWKPPQVLVGCINIAGGFSGWTPTVATSIQYTLENEIHTFIELNKNAPWFLKCVGGAAAQRLKGYLASVNILSDIRDRVNALISS